MTAEYRLLYGELQTNAAATKVSHTLRGELRVISATATETLSAAGRMTAICAMVLDRPSFPNPHTRTTVAPANTTVYLERNHEIVWGGILWAVRANIENLTLQLECEGFYSYFKNKIHPWYQISIPHAGIDIFDYIRDQTGMWALSQSTPGDTNVGVDADTNDYGLAVPATLGWSYLDRKSWGDILEDIQKDYTFDWRYKVYRDPADSENIHVMLDLMSGTGLVTQYIFEVGTNCTLLTYTEDGTTVINAIDAMGAGGMPVAGDNSDSVGIEYPRLEKMLDLSDVTDLNRLKNIAKKELIRGRSPMQHVTLTTIPDLGPPFGTYGVGDKVRVRSDIGWATIDNEEFRIVEMTTSTSEGSETVQVTMTGIINFSDTAGIVVVDFV